MGVGGTKRFWDGGTGLDGGGGGANPLMGAPFPPYWTALLHAFRAGAEQARHAKTRDPRDPGSRKLLNNYGNFLH